MQMIYILLIIYVPNLNNFVTTHNSHQICVGVGHTNLQFKKSPKNSSFNETLGGASKTYTLRFKGQKDVVDEVKNIIKRLISGHKRST